MTELYNVRIIIFEYNEDLKDVIIAGKYYVSCVHIPLIILSKIKKSNGYKYGIISDINDITNSLSPMNKLSDYQEVVDGIKPIELIVQSVCNYWMDKFCPNEICQLMIKFTPKLNVRPIGSPMEDRGYLDWSQQMKNKRNEMMSYY